MKCECPVNLYAAENQVSSLTHLVIVGHLWNPSRCGVGMATKSFPPK